MRTKSIFLRLQIFLHWYDFPSLKTDTSFRQLVKLFASDLYDASLIISELQLSVLTEQLSRSL
jgi:hypothetical protein